MLSIARIQSARYYTELSRDSYYTQGGEPPGRYYGQGAAQLGLQGRVEEVALSNLLEGLSPDGSRKLRQNAGKGDTTYTTDKGETRLKRQERGWDFTFSAPKSFSVLWAMADEATRQTIERCEERAVKKTIDLIETYATSRRGKDGQLSEPAQLVVSLFQHSTSRDLDPQRHTHVLIKNIGIRADGTSGSLEIAKLIRRKKLFGALYRAELAKEMAAFGYQAGPHHGKNPELFDFKGVNVGLIERFSQRRQMIEKALQEAGTYNAVAAAVATLKTREAKQTPPRETLLQQWQAIGQQQGYLPPTPCFINHDLEANQEKAAGAALEPAMRAMGKFTKEQLMLHMAVQAPQLGLGIDAIQQAAEDLLASPQVCCLGNINGEVQYSTPQHLAMERALMTRIDEAKGQVSHSVPSEIRETVLRTAEAELTAAGKPLTPSQQRGLAHMLDDADAIKVVIGKPGTGKTTSLKIAVEAWQKSDFTVMGVAPSGIAAQGLKTAAGIQASTLHRFLYKVRDQHINPDKNFVIVVDEAGMVGTREFAQLVEIAARSKAKLVLLGDPEQLQSVQAGGGLIYAAQTLSAATMDDIVRQKEAWRRQSIVDIAAGKAQQVLSEYALRGFLSVAENWRTAQENVVEKWATQGLETPAEHLILAGTNSDVEELNRQAQAKRLQAGLLSERNPLSLNGQRFYRGDRILFTRNDRRIGISNGQLGTIHNIQGSVLTVQCDDAPDPLTIETKRYDHLRLGYAMTTHKAQGQTVEQDCYVLIGGPLLNRELSHVQLSRSKGNVYLFTEHLQAGDRLEALVKKVETSQQKHLVNSTLVSRKTSARVSAEAQR